MTHMVDIAQSVEQLIVVQQVARSSRVIHPSKAPLRRGLCHMPSSPGIRDIIHRLPVPCCRADATTRR